MAQSVDGTSMTLAVKFNELGGMRSSLSTAQSALRLRPEGRDLRSRPCRSKPSCGGQLSAPLGKKYEGGVTPF